MINFLFFYQALIAVRVNESPLFKQQTMIVKLLLESTKGVLLLFNSEEERQQRYYVVTMGWRMRSNDMVQCC